MTFLLIIERKAKRLFPTQFDLLDEACARTGRAGVLDVEALQVGVVDTCGGQGDILLLGAISDSRREDITLMAMAISTLPR